MTLMSVLLGVNFKGILIRMGFNMTLMSVLHILFIKNAGNTEKFQYDSHVGSTKKIGYLKKQKALK
jgi:archaellum biogenesis protein FlaJ (TadC family)